MGIRTVNPLKKLSVRGRKLWIMVLVPIFMIVGVVMAAIIAHDIRSQEKLLNQQAADQNTRLANVINNAIFDALSTGDNDIVRSQFSRLNQKLPGVSIYVYDFRGSISFSTDRTKVGVSMAQLIDTTDAEAAINQMLSDGQPPATINTLSDGSMLYSVKHLPILNEQSCHHCHGQSQKILGGISVASDLSSSMNAVRNTRKQSILIGLLGLLILVSAIYLLFFILVNKPVHLILNHAKKLRQGDFTHRTQTEREDELAHIQNRLNLISDAMQSIFQGFIQKSDQLAESSERLQTISEKLKSEAQSTTEQSNTVAESTSEVSATMSSVATAMEETATNISQVTRRSDELFNTISEIAESSGKAQTVIDDANGSFANVSEVVLELGQAAREIDAVTDSIREVSEQVDLLALNATIEAARAGEAGKGFAVVAQEIKELAKQTSIATHNADEKLRWMQSKTTETMEKIKKIAEIMDEASHFVNTIAAAVEEQSASTKEIADNMNQASNGVSEVNDNIARSAQATEMVSERVRNVDTSTQQILSASDSVNQQAIDLSQLAEAIKVEVHRIRV
ncbi:MAG: methyl-accepting chemotaxis protein [Desulfosarcinaceae bacterium]|nr:methyl-accepting chemotaxis protein [Desulfosarcinaceae bacterium]